MSSFVVGDETINRIVSYLFAKGNGPDDWLRYRAGKLAKMGYNLAVLEDGEKLANLMFEMNVAAVEYKKGEPEKFRSLDFKYRLAYPGSQIEAIKALETWLHQCLEKDIHLHRLYCAMEQIRNELCIDYVHSSEEYEGVQWG